MAEKEIGDGGNIRFSQMGAVWSTAIPLSVMEHRLGRRELLKMRFFA